jgi:hypothetical protein
MSGYNRFVDARFVETSQPCRLLDKPFELDVLLRTIAALLEPV